MAEYCFGKLRLPKKYLSEEVKREIEKELGVPFAFKEGGRVEITEENGVVEISDMEAKYGMFEELEEWLREKQIPFDRYSESCGDAPAERYYFRPGMVDRVVPLSYCGVPYIDTSDIRNALKLPPDEALAEIRRLLQEADPDVDPLENDI